MHFVAFSKEHKYFDSVQVTAVTAFLKDAAVCSSGNHITVMFTGRITATIVLRMLEALRFCTNEQFESILNVYR